MIPLLAASALGLPSPLGPLWALPGPPPWVFPGPSLDLPWALPGPSPGPLWALLGVSPWAPALPGPSLGSPGHGGSVLKCWLAL